MKKFLAGIAMVGVLVGGAVVLNLEEGTVDQLAKPRAARVPCEKVVDGNCPGGIVETKDYCLCLTVVKEGELADEETVISAAKRTRLVVCEADDPEAGKHLVSRYEPSALPLGKNCRLMADDLVLPGISMNSVPTGIEKKLEVVCAPCKVGPGSWNHCPECAFRGDCDKLCKEVDDGL